MSWFENAAAFIPKNYAADFYEVLIIQKLLLIV
jgi:hypothetical protein